MAGKVVLFTGPMFSGKTSSLIGAIDDCKEKFVIIRHTSDIRYLSKDSSLSYSLVSRSEEAGKPQPPLVSAKLVAHNKNSVSGFSLWCNSLEDLPPLSDVKVIFIDEGQFFHTLPHFCEEKAQDGYAVVVAGLSGTYERKPFPSIANLIPLCDEVHVLASECTLCGGVAAYSRRIVSSDSFILVGGRDSYEPRCRRCFELPPSSEVLSQ